MTELDHGHDQAAIDAADNRVLALKVLDRLHNMRTIQHLDQEKQRLKSEQTLDLVAPLAGRLGLRAIADELESIARGCLSRLPGGTGATYQLLALGVLLLPAAVRASYLDEWLGELDVLRDRRTRAGFAFRLALSTPALALTVRRPTRVPPALHAGVTRLRRKLGLDQPG